nr:uncharacterized protein LOC111512817 [Leptinotarsa decemlineata]
MYNNNVVNPWGLKETVNLKNNISKCCPCFFKSRKVMDISDSLLSKLATPVLIITTPPDSTKKSAVGTTLVTPITPRLSPRDNSTYSNDTRGNTPPPRSSGSESSGYFTPPTENRAFVKLDSEARSSESDDKDDSIENDKNNNSQDCLNPVNNEVDQRDETVVIKSPTISEGFRNVEGEVIKHNELEVLTESDVSEDKFKESRRFSISSSKELSFVASSSCTDKMSKSRSAVDFQSFLPEIPKRKSACSAPPLKDELNIYKDLIITSYEDITVFPEKIASIESVVIGTEENEIVKSPKEISVTRKLSRRLSRTPSRRSTKSTPRSVRDLTPKSTAIKPKDCLQTALAQINNQEWEVMIQGLQGLTKLAKSHPDVLEANIHNVCVCLARQIKNLRSQVARSACHTASEIFQSCKKGLEMTRNNFLSIPIEEREYSTNLDAIVLCNWRYAQFRMLSPSGRSMSYLMTTDSTDGTRDNLVNLFLYTGELLLIIML